MHGKTTKAVIAMFVAFVFLAGAGIVLNDDVKDVKAGGSGGNTLYVGGSGPNNYTKIQDAVDNASDGDTVYVFNGTYYENVFIGRSINLIGENKDTTIIDGGGSGDVVHITVDWIDICGLTVQNSGSGWNDAGIELDYGTKHCQ
ncbi:hypothetical protein J7J55_05990, partial [Candidatus Bipolaricaulota bacterium]|nr:hypothetical protein [Candidatus Bipolaricaulota bacterium]